MSINNSTYSFVVMFNGLHEGDSLRTIHSRVPTWSHKGWVTYTVVKPYKKLYDVTLTEIGETMLEFSEL